MTKDHVRRARPVFLQLRAMNIAFLDWLEPPPDSALAAANKLLDALEAAPAMADLPLPPRLAKLVMEAARRGVPEKGCAVAAVLSAGERGSSDLLAKCVAGERGAGTRGDTTDSPLMSG